jgi:YfiH family protein
MTPTQAGGLTIWRFGHLAACERLTHGITARHGGVSAPPYASLNLGLHVGDDPEAVIGNRRRVCGAVGVEFGAYTLSAQVHGANVALVAPEQIGAGRLDLADAIPDADGLIITQPGVMVSVLSADCVPLIFYDPTRHIGAVVHAGWRGTAAGIAGHTVRFLAEQCRCRPEDLLVGLGPSIGPCCYEVSEEVARRVSESAGPPACGGRGQVGNLSHGYVDLAVANRRQLLAAGVRGEHIEDAGVCTSCHAEEFFSERKLGRPTGRFSTFVVLG